MTREEMLKKIVPEEVDMLEQWVHNGCYEELHEYVKDRLSVLENGMLETYYKQLFGALPPKRFFESR